MSLRSRLDADLQEAMRAKDSVRMETIRNIKSAILLKETQGGAVDDAAVLQLIRALVKQRDDSIEQFQAGGRQDLAEKELQEKNLLLGYVPPAPDAVSVEKAVREAIAELQATTMRDMGKVMQAVSAKLGAGADNKTISEIVKKCLSP